MGITGSGEKKSGTSEGSKNGKDKKKSSRKSDGSGSSEGRKKGSGRCEGGKIGDMEKSLVTEKTFDMRSLSSSKKGDVKKLEDQVWFHGSLPRDEIESRLLTAGQFLVRVTKKEGERAFAVISVRHTEVLHFMIKKTMEEEFYLDEKLKFPSVYELVRHYHTLGRPIDKSGAILLKAVKRDPWLLDDRALKLDKKLGEGQFGEVWLGYLENKDRSIEKVAVKLCKESRTESEMAEMLEEAKLMRNFQHMNVVRVFGLAVDRLPIKIVMEFCPNGSLDSHLVKNKGKINQSEKIQFCLEAARGMEYLTSKNCIHRDLAARNCLLGKEKEVKISDFGMSKMKKARKIIKEQGGKVPFRWTAPESLKDGKFSEKSDIWSFGVLMWEIFAEGDEPWPGVTEIKIVYKKLKKGERMEIPSGTPSRIQKLMKNCWKEKARDRITFKEAVQTLESVNKSVSEKKS